MDEILGYFIYCVFWALHILTINTCYYDKGILTHNGMRSYTLQPWVKFVDDFGHR